MPVTGQVLCKHLVNLQFGVTIDRSTQDFRIHLSLIRALSSLCSTLYYAVFEALFCVIIGEVQKSRDSNAVYAMFRHLKENLNGIHLYLAIYPENYGASQIVNQTTVSYFGSKSISLSLS